MGVEKFNKLFCVINLNPSTIIVQSIIYTYHLIEPVDSPLNRNIIEEQSFHCSFDYFLLFQKVLIFSDKELWDQKQT